MANEKARALKALSIVMDNITEAQYLISETEDTRIPYETYDEVYTNLQNAMGLVEEARHTIQFNMKGE